jgi:phage gp16-like protein
MSALAAIHVAKKQLGLDDDTLRDLYERVTGKRSAKEMSEGERGRVVEELRKSGFEAAGKAASKAPRKRLEGRFAKKLQALWISAWNLGLVQERDDTALIAFVKRQTGIDHVRFVRHPEDAAKAIEGVKGWMAREAGVDWTNSRFLPDWTQSDGFRIAAAQFRILHRRAPRFAAFRDLHQYLAASKLPDATSATAADWIEIMNGLGREIRKL